jgi:hypothetical protein
MKTIATVMLALAPAYAQIHPTGAKPPAPSEAARIAAVAPAGTIPSVRTAAISLSALNTLQSGFDQELGSYGYPNDPIDILGKTRGVYLNDYGVVFTTELSPIITPPITPFHQKITEEERVKTRQRKLDRLQLVKNMMAKMMNTAAAQLTTLPDDQQVVLAVKLLYLPYEDTRGLPGEIVMKGDKRSVLAGKFTTTEE